MGSIVLLGLAGVMACWIVLALMGAERQQQLQQADAARRAAHAHAAAMAAEASKKPHATPAAHQPAR